MNFYIFLWAVISIAAAVEKDEGIKKSTRTGRQFGWQTPYTIPHNYIHSARDKFMSAQQEKYVNQMQEAKRNPKGSKGNSQALLQESLQSLPSKVNATTVSTLESDSSIEGNSVLSNKMLQSYNYQQQYNHPGYSNKMANLLHHQQPSGIYGNRRNPLNDIYSPMYDYSGLNYNQNNIYAGFTGQYPMNLGQPSFGVPGHYIPSGGIENNFNYLSGSIMAMGSKPVDDPENIFENLVPSSFLFECPEDYSFQSHVVGQATIYPDPLKCHRFYYCHMGHAYVFQCSDDLYYNPLIKACDEREHFSCGNRAL